MNDYMPKRQNQTGTKRSSVGRPPKLDGDKWGQITCVLRKATIEQLRAGADSRFFGEFLQHHLDRYPLPSREQYLAIRKDALEPAWEFHGRYPRKSKLRPAAEPRKHYRDQSLRDRVALHMALARITEEEAIKRVRKFDRNDRNDRAGKAVQS